MASSKRLGKLGYSSSEISKWFGVSRAVLRAWEKKGEIEKPELGPEGELIYRWHHIKRIAARAREHIRAEMAQAAQDNPNGLYPPPKLLEQLYRIEFFSGDDVDHGLEQLEGLARDNGLSPETCDFLIRDAMSRPRGDYIRSQLWKILLLDSGDQT